MSAPTALHGGTTPLAALTSVFTPPCPTSWLLTTTRSFSQYPPFPTTGPAFCDPPSWRTNIARAGFHYYSPAICPQGFVVGPNCGITKTRTDEGFPAIAPGETAAYCVPSGLTCTTDLTDFRGGVWGVASASTTPGALATVGPAIQIRWVEADLTKLETHPLTPGLKLVRTDTERTRDPGMGSITTTGPAIETTETPGRQPAPDEGETETSTTLGPDTQGSSDSMGGFTHIFDPPNPTTSLAPANTAGNASDGGIGSLDRTTSIVVIVVVTVVAGISLWVAAFLFVRRYKKRIAKRKGSPSTMYTDETGLEHGSHGHKRSGSGVPQSMISPASELYAGPPAIGSTPNPAELEGDVMIQPPAKTWVHQRLWHKNSSLHPPLSSPRSMVSGQSTRRTVRESFGEKVNDPATALGRLKIPNSRAIGRPSPGSASPGGRSFWRMQRSPRSPLAPARMSAQLPKPSPRSRLSGNVSRASTPGRGKPGWQGDNSDNTQRDATQ